MYQRILAAVDATPNEAGVLAQTIQLARLTGAAVHVLHVALDHIGTGDILGGLAAADDVDPREVTVVQDALAQLREAGVTRMVPRGRESLLTLRREELDSRWPGLLDAVLPEHLPVS